MPAATVGPARVGVVAEQVSTPLPKTLLLDEPVLKTPPPPAEPASETLLFLLSGPGVKTSPCFHEPTLKP